MNRLGYIFNIHDEELNHRCQLEGSSPKICVFEFFTFNFASSSLGIFTKFGSFYPVYQFTSRSGAACYALSTNKNLRKKFEKNIFASFGMLCFLRTNKIGYCNVRSNVRQKYLSVLAQFLRKSTGALDHS